MRSIVILFVFFMSTLSACSGDVSPTAEPTEIAPEPTATQIIEVDAERIAQGVTTFKSNYCGVCHTLTIANTRGEFAPRLDDIVEDAVIQYQSEAYTGKATTIEAYLYESITTPDVYIIPDFIMSPHPMPSFRHLSDEDIQDIIYLLMYQKQDSSQPQP